MVLRVHTNLKLIVVGLPGKKVDLKGCTGGGLFSRERKRKGGGGGGLNKSREGSCLKKNRLKVPRCWFERCCLMFIPYLGKFDPKFY